MSAQGGSTARGGGATRGRRPAEALSSRTKPRPVPCNLPSQKNMNNGQDPNLEIVPCGGPVWASGRKDDGRPPSNTWTAPPRITPAKPRPSSASGSVTKPIAAPATPTQPPTPAVKPIKEAASEPEPPTLSDSQEPQQQQIPIEAPNADADNPFGVAINVTSWAREVSPPPPSPASKRTWVDVAPMDFSEPVVFEQQPIMPPPSSNPNAQSSRQRAPLRDTSMRPAVIRKTIILKKPQSEPEKPVAVVAKPSSKQTIEPPKVTVETVDQTLAMKEIALVAVKRREQEEKRAQEEKKARLAAKIAELEKKSNPISVMQRPKNPELRPTRSPPSRGRLRVPFSPDLATNDADQLGTTHGGSGPIKPRAEQARVMAGPTIQKKVALTRDTSTSAVIITDKPTVDARPKDHQWTTPSVDVTPKDSPVDVTTKDFPGKDANWRSGADLILHDHRKPPADALSNDCDPAVVVANKQQRPDPKLAARRASNDLQWNPAVDITSKDRRHGFKPTVGPTSKGRRFNWKPSHAGTLQDERSECKTSSHITSKDHRPGGKPSIVDPCQDRRPHLKLACDVPCEVPEQQRNSLHSGVEATSCTPTPVASSSMGIIIDKEATIPPISTSTMDFNEEQARPSPAPTLPKGQHDQRPDGKRTAHRRRKARIFDAPMVAAALVPATGIWDNTPMVTSESLGSAWSSAASVTAAPPIPPQHRRTWSSSVTPNSNPNRDLLTRQQSQSRKTATEPSQPGVALAKRAFADTKLQASNDVLNQPNPVVEEKQQQQQQQLLRPIPQNRRPQHDRCPSREGIARVQAASASSSSKGEAAAGTKPPQSHSAYRHSRRPSCRYVAKPRDKVVPGLSSSS